MFIRRRNLFPPKDVSGRSIFLVKIELLGLHFISSFFAREGFVPNTEEELFVFFVVGVVLLKIKAFFLIYPPPYILNIGAPLMYSS
jgi:hypothetical protein